MSGRRSLTALGLATAVVAAATAGLGTWQVQRLAWKRELIATVGARVGRAPIAAPDLATARATDPAALDFVPVTVSGRFLPGIEARVQAILGEPRGRFGGPGVWVMAPLERDDGSIVWIDRGFAPHGRASPAERGETTPEGPVTIGGLMRRGEPRGAFTPADDPARGTFFARDPLALAAAFDLAAERVAPYTIDAGVEATPPGGLPQAGETRLVFENRHLGYALTWYGLSAAAIGTFAALAWSRRRRPDGGGAARSSS